MAGEHPLRRVVRGVRRAGRTHKSDHDTPHTEELVAPECSATRDRVAPPCGNEGCPARVPACDAGAEGTSPDPPEPDPNETLIRRFELRVTGVVVPRVHDRECYVRGESDETERRYDNEDVAENVEHGDDSHHDRPPFVMEARNLALPSLHAMRWHVQGRQSYALYSWYRWPGRTQTVTFVSTWQ